MTITEANDTNVVLRYLLGAEAGVGLIPSDDQALEAAQRLAARANKALGAGLTADGVTAAWPNVAVG